MIFHIFSIFFFSYKELIIMVSLNDIKERNSYHININYDDIYDENNNNYYYIE